MEGRVWSNLITERANSWTSASYSGMPQRRLNTFSLHSCPKLVFRHCILDIMSEISPMSIKSRAPVNFFLMGVESIPIVSQFKSLIQYFQGDLEGAAKTQDDFSRKCLVISQLRSAVEAAMDRNDEALKTQLIFISPSNAVGQGLMLGSAILAPIAAGATIAGLGFQAGGIAAGSAASAFMATYGGSVSAGSLCALLQSAGAAGLGAGTATLMSSTAGMSVGLLSNLGMDESLANSEEFGIVSFHGNFITSHPFHFECNCKTYGRWQQFKFYHLEKNVYALQCWHDGFLSAKNGDVSITRSVTNDERFELSFGDNGKISIKSCSNEKYLCAELNGSLMFCTTLNETGYFKFSIKDML
jgi:hypothetical protein